MRAAAQLLAAPAAQALGWMLLHFLWEGAAIAAAIALALPWMRTPRLRYGAAFVALAAMPLVCAITFLCIAPDHAGARMVSGALPVASASAASSAAPPHGLALADAARWAVPVWLLGVLLLEMRTLAGWMAARRLRRSAAYAAPAFWRERLTALAQRMRVSRPVALAESWRVDVPAVIGYFRPVILAPLDLLAGMPPGQVEAILLHELAHIRRRDYLVNLLQAIVEGLLFYHPAVWWISGIVRAERENCCDDLVLEVRGNAGEYAAALAALEEARWAAEPAVAATGGNLMLRMRRILGRAEQPQAASKPALSAALVVGAAVAALALSAGAAHARPQDTPKPAVSPYVRWVNEDVAYIITDQERAAFKKLQTDAERDHFIQQFWDRRNPTPGSAQNPFKVEHYRRIAFANRHFAEVLGTPGWKTDRGRVYIVYGPPDEIESHFPGGAAHKYAYEQWLYHRIAGIGGINVIIEFDDFNNSGEYHMAKDPRGPR